MLSSASIGYGHDIMVVAWHAVMCYDCTSCPLPLSICVILFPCLIDWLLMLFFSMTVFTVLPGYTLIC